MKKMILVTDNFPYGAGDSPLIGAELKAITGEFDVAIISCGASTERTCGLPAEIGVYHCPQNPSSWVLSCFKALFSTMFYRELRRVAKQAKHPLLAAMQCIDYFGESESFSAQFKAVVEAEGKPDIVYCFWHRPQLLGVLRSKKYCPGARVVARAHRYDLYADIYPAGYYPFKQECDRLIDRVFLISQDGLDYYRENYAVSPEPKYELAYLGVNNERTAPWEKCGILRLVSCSDMQEHKRLDLIVSALSMIDGVKIRWTHIGTGPQKSAIEKLIKDKLSKKENIECYLTGEMQDSQIMEHLSAAPYDFIISASSSEGLPVSLMEAYSFGLPAIAVTSGGIAELVDESCGIPLPRDSSAETLSEAFRRASELPEDEYLLMRSAAREKWRSRFVAAENAKNFAQRLAALCSSSGIGEADGEE